MNPQDWPAALVWMVGGAVGVLGLLFGSFSNVLIARIPEGLSIAYPASRCPHCLTPIRWYDNVPLVSWLVLRGKCRSCKAPISFRYPAVELLMALLFVAAYVELGPGWPLWAALSMTLFLVPLTFIDLEHWILPFELTLPGLAAGLLLALPQGLSQLRDCAVGAGLGFALFWAMEVVGRWAFKKEALGGGDKYLLALLGAYLTWRPMLGIVMLSSFQGALVGVVLLAVRGRAGPAPRPAITGSPDIAPAPDLAEKSAAEDSEEEDDWEPGPTNMPFGPWLALSGLEILLLGPWLAQWLTPSMALLLFGVQVAP